MTNNFIEYLEEVASLINQQLEQFYDLWRDDATRVHPSLIPLTELAIKANLGGKRLRGVLVDLGFRLASNEQNSEIIKCAAAFEIFQTAILAHDDIIDKSPTRRGVPTIYKALGGDHYAISQTICIGDIGFYQAFQILVSVNLPEDRKNIAAESFAKTMTETALGEMLDVELSQKNVAYQEEDALMIFKLKTARYTLVGPLEVGAILGGANQELLNQLKEFGENLGIAFQIQDDVLGVFGDEETLGKSVTSDIEEGKNTLLITEALKNSDIDQKRELEGLYGKGQISEEGLEKIRKIFKDTGALEYSQKKAQELVEKSKKVLKEMEIKDEYKDLLSQMSEYIISRNK